jgi:hypothetical protein
MAVGVDNRPDVNHYQGAPDDERDLVEETVACVQAFEEGIGRDFKERCETFYRQYRGFKKFRNAWEAAGPNDRDGVVYDAKKTWGANLHIPLSFRTIETMVPRAIAQRPRMLYLPRDEQWEDNVKNVRMLIDAQQEQIDIELEFQDVMRSGMIYGIGFSKTFWRREYATRRRVKRRMFKPGAYVVGKLKRGARLRRSGLRERRRLRLRCGTRTPTGSATAAGSSIARGSGSARAWIASSRAGGTPRRRSSSPRTSCGR